MLWLLPLAVLARPRWRDLLIWQACEIFYFASVWLYLGGFTASGTSGATDPVYLWAIAIRVAGEIFLMTMVVRDILDPRRDPVRNRPHARSDGAGQPTTTWSNVVVVKRTRTATSSPTSGTVAPDGRNSIDTCMCGGSANQRCFPSTVNGERTSPAASRPPRASDPARARTTLAPVGASSAMPCAVPPETTSSVPARGAVRCR